MIDLDEINREIERLEHDAKTTYGNCERLAILHTVRDRYSGETQKRAVQEHSFAAPASAFVEAFKAVPEDDALAVLDEHMQTIAILYPKEYNAIIRKLNEKKA